MRGRVYWVAYYAPDPDTGRAREFRESGGTEADAKRLLRKRLGEIYGETFVGPEAERITVGELLDAYCEHLVLAGRKSIHRAPAPATGYRGSVMAQVKPLQGAFEKIRARELTTHRIRVYMGDRLEQDYERSTVRNEVAVLRAAFKLAHREGLVRQLPHFPSLTVRNARKVFYEPAEVDAIVAALPDPLNDLVRGYYLTGRRKAELRDAEWEWVDRRARTLTIPDTKNGDAAVIPLEGELWALIERRWKAREYRRTDGAVAISPWIFHRRGKPIRKFAVAFNLARIAAGVPHKTVHDLRRTALRDFVRAGVHQHVAMQMTGHRSAEVFKRYDIIDVRDIRKGLAKVADYRSAQQQNVVGIRP